MHDSYLERVQKRSQVLEDAINLSLQTIRCVTHVLKVHLTLRVEQNDAGYKASVLAIQTIKLQD